MTFVVLALIVAAGLVGPLLAWSDKLRIPVVIGELAAGIVVGGSGLRWVDPTEPTLTFLADIGFATVMFVAGSHVPVRDRRLVAGSRGAVARLAVVVVVAVGLAWAVAHIFGTGHTGLYAVLFASSSAAVIMPMASSLRLTGPTWTHLIPQIALADALGIVALPLVLDPGQAGASAIGAVLVIGCSAAVFGLLWFADRRGWLARAHDKSRSRDFALELRVSLLILVALAALAVQTHVSIMLAGFGLGIAVAAVGEPRRLARQLFGLTEGVFGPIFFVWLGASLDLTALVHHPAMIGLGLAVGAAAVVAHGVAALFRLPLSGALMTSAQLGLPVAAVTIGSQTGRLDPGEGAALLLGALVTIATATVAGRRLARQAAEPAVADPPVKPSADPT